LAIDDDDFMAAFEQVPRCADADDAGAEDGDFHRDLLAGQARCGSDAAPRLRAMTRW